MRCDSCQLCKVARHVKLDGKGDPNSKLWIIVERPNQQEDLSNVPFSSYLNNSFYKYFDQLGIQSDQVYLTYASKCFLDTKNGDPELVSEKGKLLKICVTKWLHKELEEYKPTCVITLGAEVTRVLLSSTGSIFKLRGSVQSCTVNNVTFDVVPSYSLGFIQGERKELEHCVVEDIKKGYEIATGTIQRWTDDKLAGLNYKDISSLDVFKEFEEELHSAVYVACDTETRGLDLFRKDIETGFPLVSIQFSTKVGTAWFLPIAHVKYVTESNIRGMAWLGSDWDYVLKTLKWIFESGNISVIGHNWKFDSKWIYRWLGIKSVLAVDTMLAAGLLEEASNSLKKIAWIVSPLGGYEEAQSKYTDTLPVEQRYDMFFYPYEQLCLYGCADADVTYRAFEYFRPKINASAANRFLLRMLVKASNTFTDIELDGIKIDEEYLVELNKFLESEMGTREQQFRLNAAKWIYKIEEQLVIEATGKSGKLLAHKPTKFNLSSPAHIATLLFDHLGIKADDNFKSKITKEPSAGTPFLKTIVAKYPIVADLIEYKKLSKQKSGFCDAYPQFIIDGRIHPNYNLIKFFDESTDTESGTISGRLSSSSPNLQQVPSRGDGKRIKKLFVPDYSEHYLVDADMSGIELRVTAMFANDPLMKDFFNKGEGDFHRYVASKVYKKPEAEITDLERTYAKTTVFAILYQASPKKIAQQIGCTIKEAETFIEEYFEVFPAVRKWINKQKISVQRNLSCTSLFGRVRQLPGAGSRIDFDREAALRRGINTPVQSTASDIMLYSVCRIYDYLEDFNHSDPAKPSRLRGSVHDSVLLSVHENDLEEIVHHVKFNILENVDLPFIQNKGVRLQSDVKIGKDWGNMEKLSFEDVTV